MLVPADSQDTPQSVQDREPPSTMPVTTIPASSGTVRRLVLVQSQQREPISRSDEAVSTVPGTPVGLALADGGFDVGSTAEDSQQVSPLVEVLPAHPSRRVVLARMEGVAAEESLHMLHDSPPAAVQTTQGDSDTETQDSRRSIVDVPEFDFTRGSDEEVIPFDSPGSEVEFEESIAGEEEAVPVSEEEFPDVPDVRAPVLRAAFRTLDDVDTCHQFRQRAAVMKSVPRIFQGLFRNALKVALKEIIEGAGEVEQERGWKLLLMLPRMLLHCPPGGSKVSKSKLRARFESFSRGDWIDLIGGQRAVR